MEALHQATRGLVGQVSSPLSADTRESVDAAPQAQEGSDEENEALIQHNRSQHLDPQQFRDARAEAIQQAAMESGWFTWLLFVFCFQYIRLLVLCEHKELVCSRSVLAQSM